MTRLCHEELVPLEAFWGRKSFDDGSQRLVGRTKGGGHFVEVQNPIRVVPAHCPICSDDFQSMDRRSLKIVNVDSAHGPTRELQPNLGDVLHVYLERGHMSVESPQ